MVPHRMPDDESKYQLSDYLSKLPQYINRIGLPSDKMTDQCSSLMTERMSDPPSWFTVTQVNMSCQHEEYMLCRMPEIDDVEQPSCGHNHYSCKDGTCIIQHRHCDGRKDCKDGSDEMGCPAACTTSDGALNNSQCFTYCQQPYCTCYILYYQCPASACISTSKLCSNILHDDSVTLAASQPKSGPYEERDGIHKATVDINNLHVLPTDDACVYTRQRLGNPLHQGQHLKHCYHYDCPGMYKCHHSYCIPYRYVCDGQNDCPSAEEEEGCGDIICPGMLKCIPDNVCISPDEVCDNMIHCPLGCDDETDCMLGPCPSECQCFGLGLLCKNLSLHYLPDISIEVKAVDLSKNILEISDMMFFRYTSLIKLNLSDNAITVFPPKIFIKSSKLETLEMNDNNIQLIQKHAFFGLHSLSKLNLEENKLMHIESYGFYGVVSVTMLNFGNQELTIIDGFSFWGAQSLQLLNLSCNKVTHLHKDSLKGLDNLSVLDISGNDITYVDNNVFQVVPTMTTLISSTVGLCCFALFVERCTPLIFAQSMCMGLINTKAEEFLNLSFAMLNGCLNISAIILLVRNMVRQKDLKGWRVIYLHLFDIILVVHVAVRLIFNNQFGMLFAFQFASWYKGVPCKVISFFLLANIHCSSASVLFIIIEWYIIIRFPFQADDKVKQIRILLDFYWVIPLLATILDILILNTNHTRCLFVTIDSDMHLLTGIVTMIVLVTVTMVPPVLTVILSSQTTKLIRQSIIESGRKEAGSNAGLFVLLVLINVLNLIRMFSLGTLISIQFLKQPPPDAFILTLTFLGTHVPSTIHPLLFFPHHIQTSKSARNC